MKYVPGHQNNQIQAFSWMNYHTFCTQSLIWIHQFCCVPLWWSLGAVVFLPGTSGPRALWTDRFAQQGLGASTLHIRSWTHTGISGGERRQWPQSRSQWRCAPPPPPHLHHSVLFLHNKAVWETGIDGAALDLPPCFWCVGGKFDINR